MGEYLAAMQKSAVLLLAVAALAVPWALSAPTTTKTADLSSMAATEKADAKELEAEPTDAQETEAHYEKMYQLSKELAEKGKNAPQWKAAFKRPGVESNYGRVYSEAKENEGDVKDQSNLKLQEMESKLASEKKRSEELNKAIVQSQDKASLSALKSANGDADHPEPPPSPSA